MSSEQIEIPLGKRHNHAYGMVLSVEDLLHEFSYLQERMKFLCRTLIGSGTVSGLQVSSSSDEEAESILVKAGTAIDSQGNEILLASAVKCPLPSEGKIAYLVLYRAERETDFVPVPGSEDEDGRGVPTYIEEYAILKYEAKPNDNKHSGIVLARLKKVRGTWKLDRKFRRQKAKVR